MVKFSKILSNLLIVLLVAAALVFAVPRLFGIHMFSVLSGSMEPAYHVGDLIYAVPTEPDAIQKDDVISFLLNDDGMVATHRVIEIDRENHHFYTKGDANEIPDGSPVHFNNVVGVVRFRIPLLGRLAEYLSSVTGKIIAVTAVASLCILVLLLEQLGRQDKEDESEDGRRLSERGKKRKKRKKEGCDMKETNRVRFRYDPEQGFVHMEGDDKGHVPSRHGKKKKRLHTFSFMLLVVLAVTATVTLMYMTALTPTVTNAFTIGSASVVIEEPEIDPDQVEWGADSKPVILENPAGEDRVPGIVRAMLIPGLKDEEGNAAGGNLGTITQPSGNTMVLGDITLHFADDWSSHWFYQNGYFYYRKVLNPGEKTTKLLSGVTLTNGSLSDPYVDSGKVTVTIDVLADILQTAGNAPETEWGVTVGSGGEVTPKN